ncbi:helix-turn-helix domain-containing protein [Bacillus wiedmannii]|uniref:helix-turn-helix domain-containing protein n=1 Tax=Bacillus wiedmannii TaxID=1890302 RepID=UPI000BFC503E|nr:helix-turn-helix transcriptional regulator [Bacillus wiedmannii]PHA61732.1 hypothetical protein COE75_18025 [Bacillus wiedmannii]
METNERELVLNLTNEPLSVQVRTVRAYKGWTQHDLAERIGLNYSDFALISRIENGRRGIPAKYTDLVEQFLYEDEQKGVEQS